MARRDGEDSGEFLDASRRTRLAAERTQLAWWRTGLTAVAVAVGVGRIVPELDKAATRWPYTVLGACFALYAVGLFAYGSVRFRSIEGALDHPGYESVPPWALSALTLSECCVRGDRGADLLRLNARISHRDCARA